MKKTIIFFLFSFAIHTISSQSLGLLPSEALALMYHAVNENPDKKRLENTLPFEERVRTQGLSPLEQYYLGEVYFWNLKPNESKAAFSKVLNESSIISDAARLRIWIININGFGLHNEVEKDIRDYIVNTKANPKDRFGASVGISLLSRHLLKNEKHQTLVSLIDDEMERLNTQGAYVSFLLPIRFFDSYKQIGADKQMLRKLETIKEGLEKTLAERINNSPEKDFTHTVYCPPVSGMENSVTEHLGFEQQNQRFQEIIDKIENFIKQN